MNFERIITRAQVYTVTAMMVMLVLVVVLSTVHLGILIVEETMKPPRFLIPVSGLLGVFSYFLLVLIGVELLETLKLYCTKNAIQVRIVVEVALIALARKIITQEPSSVESLSLFGVAALILALGVALYVERRESTG